jgi:hypothetical protein
MLGRQVKIMFGAERASSAHREHPSTARIRLRHFVKDLLSPKKSIKILSLESILGYLDHRNGHRYITGLPGNEIRIPRLTTDFLNKKPLRNKQQTTGPTNMVTPTTIIWHVIPNFLSLNMFRCPINKIKNVCNFNWIRPFSFYINQAINFIFHSSE